MPISNGTKMLNNTYNTNTAYRHLRSETYIHSVLSNLTDFNSSDWTHIMFRIINVVIIKKPEVVFETVMDALQKYIYIWI